MANEFDEEDEFREFHDNLSAEYPSKKYRWLRFLLYDHLPISLLARTDVAGFDLFNQLHTQGDISYTDVNILSEIAEVTKMKSAITLIKKHVEDNPQNPQNNGGLKKFRKDLFKAMTDVATEDLQNIRAFYELDDHDFKNIWDLVFHLEKQGRLDDTEKKIKRFANRLNAKAKRTLLANLPKPTAKPKALRGASTSSSSSTTAKQDTITTSKVEPLPTTEMNIKEFHTMLIKVSSWYQGKNYTNRLKLLYNEMITNVQSFTTTKDLFDSLKVSGKLKPTDFKVLIDTIKITDTRGIVEVDDSLRDANIEGGITSFSIHRQNLIQLGNALSAEDTRKVGDMYNVPSIDYNKDQWTLIMILEREDVICEDTLQSFIQDLKNIDLHHAAAKLQNTVARKGSHEPDNEKMSPGKQSHKPDNEKMSPRKRKK